jgi:hypothetical protein
MRVVRGVRSGVRVRGGDGERGRRRWDSGVIHPRRVRLECLEWVPLRREWRGTELFLGVGVRLPGRPRLRMMLSVRRIGVRLWMTAVHRRGVWVRHGRVSRRQEREEPLGASVRSFRVDVEERPRGLQVGITACLR